LVELTDKTYEKLMELDGIVFVKFYVPWCSWCKILDPTWKELPTRFLAKDPVRIARIDCTHAVTTCKANNITIYPTLILFKRGKKNEEYNGVTELKTLHRFVKLHVKYLYSDEL
jgi:thioredoxin domain-containing protein 5